MSLEQIAQATSIILPGILIGLAVLFFVILPAVFILSRMIFRGQFIKFVAILVTIVCLLSLIEI